MTDHTRAPEAHHQRQSSAKSTHVESTGARRHESSSAATFLLTNEKGDEQSVSMCDGGSTMFFQRKVELQVPTAGGMSSEQ